MIAEAFVYGDSTKSHLVGIFVPDQKKLIEFAKSKNIDGSIEDLCKNKELKIQLQKELGSFAKSENLQGFEIVKAIDLEPASF